MNFFEKFLTDLLIAGEIAAPIFIHSKHGTAILNASEEGLNAILQAHQAQAAKTAAPPPTPPVQP